MKQAKIPITDELERAIENYRQDHNNLPAVDPVVQTALRAFLTDRGYLPESADDDIHWPGDIIPGSGRKPSLYDDAPALLITSTGGKPEPMENAPILDAEHSVSAAVIEDRR